MIRVRRPRSADPRRQQRDSVPSIRTTNSTAFTRRSLGLSAAPMFFPRRSDSGPVDAVAAAASSAQSSNTALNTSRQRTFDPFALVRRLPTRVSGPCYVKSARHLAVFSRFERYWLELRGRLVVMFLHDNIWTSSPSTNRSIFPNTSSTNNISNSNYFSRRNPNTSPLTPSSSANGPLVAHPPPKDAVIVAVFTVEKCIVLRPRSKSPVLKISNPSHPQHVWLRFDSDHECNIWEKALCAAAAQRVVGISDFEFISPIGRGASGKVFLVCDRNTREKLALKVIDKSKVFESKSSLRHALDERLALEMVDGHPFFCRLRYAFQTRAYFYLAIDFYDGGDLYQYLRTHSGRLEEVQVRAVAAEVLLALEHLHSLGFVYRDLKPENVLLDCHGHVRLADFGLCKLLNDKPLTDTICGTHTYAAPEMLVRNYGKSIDLWAYGVFVYHILRGRTPYEARDLDQVIENMNLRRIRFSKHTSKDLVTMIKKLLDYNPNTRLGCGPGGMSEVRSHPFFKGLDWSRVYRRDETLPRLFMKPRKLNGRIDRNIPSSSHDNNTRNNNNYNNTHVNNNNTINNNNNSNHGPNVERQHAHIGDQSGVESHGNPNEVPMSRSRGGAAGSSSTATTATDHIHPHTRDAHFGSSSITPVAGSSSSMTSTTITMTGTATATPITKASRSRDASIDEERNVDDLNVGGTGMGTGVGTGAGAVLGTTTESVKDRVKRLNRADVAAHERERENRTRFRSRGRLGGHISTPAKNFRPDSSSASAAQGPNGKGNGTLISGFGSLQLHHSNAAPHNEPDDDLKSTTTTTTTTTNRTMREACSAPGLAGSVNRSSRRVRGDAAMQLNQDMEQLGCQSRNSSHRRSLGNVTVDRHSADQVSQPVSLSARVSESTIDDISANTNNITNISNNTSGANNVSNKTKPVSLREQMAAAAEQDDLRNFDMTEWGKISVDNDHDDADYGDGALWPFSRSRRKLSEEERMIAGFGYCSCSTAMDIPEHLRMPLAPLPNSDLLRRGKPLKYSSSISPNPQANLSGWFDRPYRSLWQLRRWLELRGSTLIYRHTRHSPAQWSVDLRECRVIAGSKAKQLIITRPNHPPLSLFAPTLDEFKLWFTEVKRVSDNIHAFYHLAASISHVATGPIYLATDRNTNQRLSVFAHHKHFLTSAARLAIQKRDSRVLRISQQHPSLLYVIDVFETSQTAYIVTELVTGGSLHDLLFFSNYSKHSLPTSSDNPFAEYPSCFAPPFAVLPQNSQDVSTSLSSSSFDLQSNSVTNLIAPQKTIVDIPLNALSPVSSSSLTPCPSNAFANDVSNMSPNMTDVEKDVMNNMTVNQLSSSPLPSRATLPNKLSDRISDANGKDSAILSPTPISSEGKIDAHGSSDSTELKSKIHLTEDDVRRIARDILSGLAHLHSNEIVHGVLDADHIICLRPLHSLQQSSHNQNEQYCKISTFSAACASHGVTDRMPADAFARAPEVVCFQLRSPAADIFAAAVLIHRLLTGVPPFQAQEEEDFLSAVSHGPSGPAWDSLPSIIHPLLCAMLREKKEDRPSARACLRHAWFVQPHSEDADDGEDVENEAEEVEDEGVDRHVGFWTGHVDELNRWKENDRSPVLELETSSVSGEGTSSGNIDADDTDIENQSQNQCNVSGSEPVTPERNSKHVDEKRNTDAPKMSSPDLVTPERNIKNGKRSMEASEKDNAAQLNNPIPIKDGVADSEHATNAEVKHSTDAPSDTAGAKVSDSSRMMKAERADVQINSAEKNENESIALNAATNGGRAVAPTAVKKTQKMNDSSVHQDGERIESCGSEQTGEKVFLSEVKQNDSDFGSLLSDDGEKRGAK